MTDLVKQEGGAIMTGNEHIYGFEDTKSEDFIIPRIKVINALSPERIDGIATEGDIINSLSQESIVGKRFIPIKQYYSNIWWNPDRNADDRVLCRSMDGRIGRDEDGVLACSVCKKNQWDNSKKGKDAQPICTAYLNFLGFFEDNPMPVVLSFAKTNYNEGKKMLSMARSLRTSLWGYAYKLEGKKVTKDRNTWYNIVTSLVGETSPEEKALAFEMYKAYEDTVINAEYDDMSSGAKDTVHDEQTENEIG